MKLAIFSITVLVCLCGMKGIHADDYFMGGGYSGGSYGGGHGMGGYSGYGKSGHSGYGTHTGYGKHTGYGGHSGLSGYGKKHSSGHGKSGGDETEFIPLHYPKAGGYQSGVGGAGGGAVGDDDGLLGGLGGVGMSKYPSINMYYEKLLSDKCRLFTFSQYNS
jgi:hypothetical protein